MKENSTLKGVANNSLTHTKKNKGVTLIALAVTIIVMLILAGATMSILTGDSGIITNAKKSKKANEIASAEEEAQMVYSQKLQDSQVNDDEPPTLADIENDLSDSFKSKGYKIIRGLKVEESGTPVIEIKLSTQNIILGQGESQDIEMIFDGGSIGEYYLQIGNEYHKILLENKKLSIERENRKITENIPTLENITIVSTDSEAFEGQINGNSITITGKNATTSTGKIILKNGNTTLAECNVTILSTSDMQNVIEAKNIANSTDKTAYYGKSVTNYENNVDGIGYQIFYADEENIYLIANTYLTNTNQVPKRGNVGLKEGTKQALIFSEDLLNQYPNGIGTIANKNQEIINKWLSKYRNNKNLNSDKANSKAIAYMLDTEIWNKLYVNDKVADYAIGGPTLEMFVKSWNNVNSANKQIDCDVLSDEEVGYAVKYLNKGSYSNAIENAKSENCQEIYQLNDNNLVGMFLASPSQEHENCIMLINVYGWLCAPGYDVDADNGDGFRPVICLNKNTKLLKTTEGFKILGI